MIINKWFKTQLNESSTNDVLWCCYTFRNQHKHVKLKGTVKHVYLYLKHGHLTLSFYFYTYSQTRYWTFTTSQCVYRIWCSSLWIHHDSVSAILLKNSWNTRFESNVFFADFFTLMRCEEAEYNKLSIAVLPGTYKSV